MLFFLHFKQSIDLYDLSYGLIQHTSIQSYLYFNFFSKTMLPIYFITLFLIKI